MTDREKKKSLPKFGSWDVNNPAAAGQYSMVFDRARNEKRAGQDRRDASPRLSTDKASFASKDRAISKPSSSRKWLCCSSHNYAES
ncbi:hypothetical protein SASPL_141095 [Salvia splendens]|uniref:RIN4 pathogenic type III effector avirulence factor Avr cleavage site domain-containing protein n=1 Tax=Salvia splendens TaxID=180675 RepID=A0A8X8ZD37_SALSN|nr:hypothetical protein SASPL_141095 [Salvia splendens]